jgi:hypothetical protein
MQDIISAVILVATLFGGTVAADKIYHAVQRAALTKAAQGLPPLSNLAAALTKSKGGVEHHEVLRKPEHH